MNVQNRPAPQQNWQKQNWQKSFLGSPAIISLSVIFMLALCTWGLAFLRRLTDQPRPYTILYLIPVAVSAALAGTRFGMGTAAVTLLLARLFLLNDQRQGIAPLLALPKLPETIEFLALAAGTMTIALVTGRLRTTLGLLRKANAQLIESERQRQEFNRDVLLAVTDGKLRLVERQEMPPSELVSGVPILTRQLRASNDVTELRGILRHLAQELAMAAERVEDLCISVSEAATNAVKHGGGGNVQAWIGDKFISVLIADQGTGIAPAHLARATLEQGFSTRVSLGMGFFLMLKTADVLALSTGSQGTAVLLQISNTLPVSDKEALLARYGSL